MGGGGNVLAVYSGEKLAEIVVGREHKAVKGNIRVRVMVDVVNEQSRLPK